MTRPPGTQFRIRVRRGQLYRSVELANLDDDGLAAFPTLGVGTVYDLRTDAERRAEPDWMPAGTAHVVPTCSPT